MLLGTAITATTTVTNTITTSLLSLESQREEPIDEINDEGNSGGGVGNVCVSLSLCPLSPSLLPSHFPACVGVLLGNVPPIPSQYDHRHR